jgi:peptidoglycan/LPS O-acetylase OafA/YrhL
LAILLVIFFHYTNGVPLTPANGAAFYVQRAAAGGWTGVDLFFVLSGFLIGAILLDARGSGSFFRTFYVRRFFRIIPIYYLWIALYIALVVFAGAAVQIHSFSGKALPLSFPVYAHFLFIQNLLPRFSSELPGLWGAWFGHLWSLAIEEQFYLIAPLLIAWMSLRRLAGVLAAIVLCAPVFRTLLFLRLLPIDVAHLMPSRADSLALGMLAAVVWRTPSAKAVLRRNAGRLKAVTAALAGGYGLLCWFAPGSETLPIISIGFTWIAVFYVLLLLVVMTDRESHITAVMRLPLLRSIGRVSYCMYVIHLVVSLFLYSVVLHVRPEIVTLPVAALAILAAVVTYSLARASWWLLESPLVRIGHRFRYHTLADEEAVQLTSN